MTWQAALSAEQADSARTTGEYLQTRLVCSARGEDTAVSGSTARDPRPEQAACGLWLLVCFALLIFPFVVVRPGVCGILLFSLLVQALGDFGRCVVVPPPFAHTVLLLCLWHASSWFHAVAATVRCTVADGNKGRRTPTAIGGGHPRCSCETATAVPARTGVGEGRTRLSESRGIVSLARRPRTKNECSNVFVTSKPVLPVPRTYRYLPS